MISFELNVNDAESLLHHCNSFAPDSGDAREDRRLRSALDELADAIRLHLRPTTMAPHESHSQ
jgi:hypothetical protein